MWRMHHPAERSTSLKLRDGGPPCALPSSGTAPTSGCTPATRSPWRMTPRPGYRADADAGKEALR
jgi:hypothetical protein